MADFLATGRDLEVNGLLVGQRLEDIIEPNTINTDQQNICKKFEEKAVINIVSHTEIREEVVLATGSGDPEVNGLLVEQRLEDTIEPDTANTDISETAVINNVSDRQIREECLSMQWTKD